MYAGLFAAPSAPLSNGKLTEWDFSSFGFGTGFLAVLLLAPLFIFGVSLLMERYLTRAFYDHLNTDQILVTFGLAIVVWGLSCVLFGSNSLPFEQPERILSAGSFAGIPVLGPITPFVIGSFPQWRLWVIGITAVLAASVHLLIECTNFGLVIRVGTRDAEMARLLDIKITCPYIVVSDIDAVLAGAASVVGGPLNVVDPTIGTNILVPAPLMVVIGGVGSIVGAVVGGVVFDLTTAALVPFTPAWSQVGLYAIAVIVPLMRPQGLLGDEEAVP